MQLAMVVRNPQPDFVVPVSVSSRLSREKLKSKRERAAAMAYRSPRSNRPRVSGL